MICPLSETGPDGQARAATPSPDGCGARDAARRHGGQVRARDTKVAAGRPLDADGQRGAAGGIQAEPSGPAPDREAAIEMPADGDPSPGPGWPARLLRQLQADGVEAHGVVGGDDPLIFLAQDLVEIDIAERHEGGRRIGGRVAEPRVVVGHEPLAQIGIGGLERGDAGQAQFIDEPVLQRAIEPLAAAAGLGRVGADMLDPQVRERPADVREAGAVDRAPGLGREERPAGPIGVQGDGQANLRNTSARAVMTVAMFSAGSSWA